MQAGLLCSKEGDTKLGQGTGSSPALATAQQTLPFDPITLGLRAPWPHTGHGWTPDPSRTSCSPFWTVNRVDQGRGDRGAGSRRTHPPRPCAEQAASHQPSQRSWAQWMVHTQTPLLLKRPLPARPSAQTGGLLLSNGDGMGQPMPAHGPVRAHAHICSCCGNEPGEQVVSLKSALPLLCLSGCPRGRDHRRWMGGHG